MKKICFFMFFLISFLPFNLMAGEEALDKDIESEEEYYEKLLNDKSKFRYEIEGDMSSYFPKENSYINDLPLCNDERLVELAIGAMKAYQYQNPKNNVIGKRRQKIVLKKMSSLEEISSNNVTSRDDFGLASFLIEIKINEGVLAENIRSCKGPKIRKDANIYVVIYKKNDLVKAQVLNFSEGRYREHNLEFVY